MATDPIPGIQYIPTQRPEDVGPTSNAIKMQREYAKALMDKKYTPPNSKYPYYTWANGLSDAANTMLGAWYMKDADDKEKAQIARDASRTDANNPMGQAPPGSSPLAQTPSNAASGRAAPASPFTPSRQASSGKSGGNPLGTQVASLSPVGLPGTEEPKTQEQPSQTGASGSGDLDPKFIESQKRLEGFAGKSYPDGKQHSVGYGTKARFPGEMLNRNQADSRLQDELWKATKVVDGIGVPMTKGQREALTSLTYNTGSKWTNSGLGQAVRSGDWNAATQLLQQYNHAGGKVDPGLTSRRAAEAHAMADPDAGLTADLVDYHRTKNAVGAQLAQNGPVYPRIPYTGAPSTNGAPPTSGVPQMQGLPTQGAQPPSLFAQPKAWDPVSMYSGLVADFRRNGHSMADAQSMAADHVNKMRELMPEYKTNPLGLTTATQPGHIETVLPGVTPGYPGTLEPITGVPGAMLQKKVVVDPTTGQPRFETEIVRPTRPGATSAVPASTPSTATASAPGLPGGVSPLVTAPPRSPSGAPPTPAGGGAFATDALPVTANAAWGNIPPPKGNPLMQLAQLGTGVPTPDTVGSAPDAVKRLPTSNPPERTPNGTGWMDYMDRFSKAELPEIATGMKKPSIYDEDIEHYPAKMKQWEAAGTEQAKKNIEIYSKWLENIHDTGGQSRKQMPALKQSLHMLDNPELGLEQGPFAPTVTMLKSMRQEIGRIGEKFGIPGADKWAKMEGGDPNQILQKNVAALTLENLRGMLGPNSGQFRQYEMQLMSKALGSDELSPGAQKTVMSIIDRINDRNSLFDQMATEWENKYGALDPRFKAAVVKFDLDHPTFTPEEFDKNMKALEGGEVKPDEKGGGAVGTPPPGGWKTLEGGTRMRVKPQ